MFTNLFSVYRHSNKPQPQDRVNKYLASALTARSVDREKRDHVNVFTLRFKESSKERRVHLMFKSIKLLEHTRDIAGP